MPTQPREQYFDLPEGTPLTAEHLDESVQLATQQEQALKRELETVEKRKRELEELSRRQDALNAGRSEVMDKLMSARVVIEREALETSKRLEMLHGINSSFEQHLQVLEAINPNAMEGADMAREFNRALAAVDHARGEYVKSFPKICTMPEQEMRSNVETGYASEPVGGDAKDFLGWLKIGLAFSLPLIIFGLVAIVVIVSRLPAK